jgi:signal peptidase I
MSFQDTKNTIKKSWKWIWNSDSIWSWLIALVIIFLFIRFIFFPGLSLIQGTSLPLAGVESSSMDHSSLKYCANYDNFGNCVYYSTDYEICGNRFDSRMFFNSDKYWETCGNWYLKKSITKDEFNSFPMKNGFSKGDIIIVWGRFTPKIGDIIIFKPNGASLAPNPIIHRIVSINNGIIETKGDHNSEQLHASNNIYKTDETTITKDQIIGKAVFKIPYLGYVKIWASDLTHKITG